MDYYLIIQITASILFGAYLGLVFGLYLGARELTELRQYFWEFWKKKSPNKLIPDFKEWKKTKKTRD